MGYAEDVEQSVRLDVYDAVPVVQGDCLIMARYDADRRVSR